MARKLTARDVRDVTGYTREELRALRDAINFHGSQRLQPRVAQEFTRQDLIVLGVIHALESKCGMRRSAISELLRQLRTALSGPRSLSRNAWLVVSLSPAVVTYMDSPEEIHEGIAIRLQTVFDRVDSHLGIHDADAHGQTNLRLSPTIVKQRKTSRSA